MSWEKPKAWAKWVNLAEYWYNTTYHTYLKTTPYKVLYGQPPPNPIAYVQGQCLVDAVDRTLAAREAMIQLLQFHLERAQQRMKGIAAAKIKDKEYGMGDWVYLKLKPHRQVSLITEGELTSLPVAILDRKLGKVGNSAQVFVLVQWSNGSVDDATWELHSDMLKRFPSFQLDA
ncbi:retrotransposable element Tf2 [Tanacetum coccineum]